MNYEEAVTILDQNYGSFSNNITSSLSQLACVTLARMCMDGTVRQMSQTTLNKLSTMDDEKQSSWLANPFMEFLCQSVLAQMTRPATTTVTTTVTPVVAVTPVTGGKPNAAPTPAPKPVAKPVEPEPEEVDMGLSLFD